MNESGKPKPQPIPALQRIVLAMLALVLLALLITAGILTPDGRGHGTHEQLGLPPCTFSLIFRRPCPACGMTTAWAWLMRGEVGRALAANAGGAMLAALSLACVPWLLMTAVRGRWFVGMPADRTITGIVLLVSLVTVGQWVWRLLTY